MALRAGYYGIKNALLRKLETLANAVVIKSIGDGLDLSAAGELSNTSVGVNYSTIEQETGITWTDDKPIYKKTINIPAINAVTEEVEHGISSFGELTNVECIFKLVTADGTITRYNVDKAAISSDGKSLSPGYSTSFNYADSINVSIRVGEEIIKPVNYSSASATITLYYTKQTTNTRSKKEKNKEVI